MFKLEFTLLCTKHPKLQYPNRPPKLQTLGAPNPNPSRWHFFRRQYPIQWLVFWSSHVHLSKSNQGLGVNGGGKKLIQQNISKWKASWGRYTPSGYSTPLWCFLRRFLVALEIFPKPPIPWLLFSTKWIKLESCEIVQQRILNFMNMGTPDLLHSSTLTSLIIRPGPKVKTNGWNWKYPLQEKEKHRPKPPSVEFSSR